jgi:hypothetical protein
MVLRLSVLFFDETFTLASSLRLVVFYETPVIYLCTSN